MAIGALFLIAPQGAGMARGKGFLNLNRFKSGKAIKRETRRKANGEVRRRRQERRGAKR